MNLFKLKVNMSIQQKRHVQIVVEVLLRSDSSPESGNTKTAVTGTGQRTVDSVRSALVARTGLEPLNYSDHGDRFTFLFAGIVGVDITPAVIENTVFRNAQPGISTVIIWGNTEIFPTSYSLHMSFGFPSSDWDDAVKQVISKLHADMVGSVSDIIISSNEQWCGNTNIPYDAARRTALEAAWEEIRKQDRVASRFSKMNYSSTGSTRIISVFEKS